MGQTEAARAYLLSTEEGRSAVILTVVTSVASAYVNLRDLNSFSICNDRDCNMSIGPIHERRLHEHQGPRWRR